jgi:hypothetical protein
MNMIKHILAFCLLAGSALAVGPIGGGSGSGAVSSVNGNTGAVVVSTPNYFYPEVAAYGAVGDGTTDDRAALQACIDAAKAVHGTVRLKANTTYKITDELVISDAVTIEGGGILPLYGPRSDTKADVIPTISPYLTGSVILQTTAAKNALKITAIGRAVNLRDFGIRFADAIKFNNTGHGIYTLPPAYTSVLDDGLNACTWSNVMVFGHDGNHYAFYLTNAQLMLLDHVEGWGGGGLCWETNTTNAFGNSTVVNPYFMVAAGGSAHGYYLKTTAAGGGNGTILMTFIRPQSIVDGGITGPATPPTSAQNTFKADAGSNWLTLVGPNFETNVNSATSIPNTLKGTWIGPGLNNKAYQEWNTPAYATSGYIAGAMMAAGAEGPDGMAYLIANGTVHGGFLQIALNGVVKAALQVNDGETYLDTTGSLHFRAGGGAGAEIASLTSTGVFTTAGYQYFSAYASGNQTLTNAVYNQITFGTVEAQSGTVYSTGTNRFTPTVAGRYELKAAVLIGTVGSPAATSAFFAYIRKNGTNYKIISAAPGETSSTAAGSCIVTANGSTDYFDVAIYNALPDTSTSGGQANVWFQGNSLP